MKLSSKGRYALLAMADIAVHGVGKALQIKHIAERQQIPHRFLEQIFQDLKRSGMVTSKRGPKGGYQLAKQADAISVGDVIGAVEGPVQLALSKDSERLAGFPVQLATQDALVELGKNVERALAEMNITDIAARAHELQADGNTPQSYVYSI